MEKILLTIEALHTDMSEMAYAKECDGDWRKIIKLFPIKKQSTNLRSDELTERDLFSPGIIEDFACIKQLESFCEGVADTVAKALNQDPWYNWTISVCGAHGGVIVEYDNDIGSGVIEHSEYMLLVDFITNAIDKCGAKNIQPLFVTWERNYNEFDTPDE